ncbi:MAG: hypothetical protein U9R42_14290, partial [Bacteroidota bacterium]|nr:hypothetical protein [Bacteroidota bacterium]
FFLKCNITNKNNKFTLQFTLNCINTLWLTLVFIECGIISAFNVVLSLLFANELHYKCLKIYKNSRGGL